MARHMLWSQKGGGIRQSEQWKCISTVLRMCLSWIQKALISFLLNRPRSRNYLKVKHLLKRLTRGRLSAAGNMTGAEVIQFMMKKAASAPKGVDPNTGYNYPQLISKFAMGAVFYNQACTNYLGDKKLSSASKPNDAPYKKGAKYTGKEHVWDEAFGYWGATPHTLTLTPKESYEVAKEEPRSR